jgi:GNAT superfamily N-acetyltransferase
VIEEELDDLRERLGLRQSQRADLLREIAALASWVVRQAEAGRSIEARRGRDVEALAHPTLDRLRERRNAAIVSRIELSDSEVERLAAALDRLPQFPIPAFLLARLAVDDRVQGQGLGRFLLEEALGLTIDLARTGPVAFRLFVTDAIDGAAMHFYERFGLLRLADGYPCRMVLDLKPLVGK